MNIKTLLLTLIVTLPAVTANAEESSNLKLYRISEAQSYFMKTSFKSIKESYIQKYGNDAFHNFFDNVTIVEYRQLQPQQFEGKDPSSYGIMWQDKDFPNLIGTKEKVITNHAPTWLIRYSKPFGNTFFVYLDSATGDILLAFSFPEG